MHKKDIDYLFHEGVIKKKNLHAKFSLKTNEVSDVHVLIRPRPPSVSSAILKSTIQDGAWARLHNYLYKYYILLKPWADGDPTLVTKTHIERDPLCAETPSADFAIR